MIDGTPVLDIKPYISDYDSPLSRPGAAVEPCEMDVDVDQPEAAASPPDEATDGALSLHTNSGSPSPEVDAAAAAGGAEVTSTSGCSGCTREDEGIATDTTNTREAPSLAHADADANANSAAPLSKELSNVLAGVKAYVDEIDLNSEQEVSKSKLPETTPCSRGPCYGEEEYSTIAAWIRAPPVGNLEVRFTPHAQRELAEFLPPQNSGKQNRLFHLGLF